MKEQERQETLLITINEASDYIGVGIDAVKRMLSFPDFPMVYIGNHRRIIKPRILEWLDKHSRDDF